MGLVLGGDQLTKTLVVRNLALYESWLPVSALYPYFQITRSHNTGAAFGFLSNVAMTGDLLLLVALVVSGVLLWSYPRIEDDQPLARFATALIVGGALGNALDRIFYGHVIDFIHYQLPGVISNVSNLADHAIVLGVGLMIWSSWRAAPPPTTTPEVDPPPAP